jgi:alkylhydroperoxidase family enzyme
MDIRHAVSVKVGLPDEKLQALATWETSDEFSPRERAALEFATAVVRDDQEVSDECYARVSEHFNEAEIVELASIVGYQTFVSKFAKAFRLKPQGFTA